MSAHLQAISPANSPCEPRLKHSPIAGAVILSPFFWNFRDDMWQTTHHIARALAQRVPTLYVEPPVQWNPRNQEFRLYRNFVSCFRRQTEAAEPGLTVFHRRGFPLGRIEMFRNLQTMATTRVIARVLKQAASGGKILWHSFPYWSEALMDSIERDFFVYHCLDYSPRDEERRLVERADVVFCVSQTLVDKYKTLNRRTFLLPNGVDLNLFDPQKAVNVRRPIDLPEGGPILGFLGYVNYHVDLELMVKVARAFPRHHVVMVGRVPAGCTAPVGRERAALRTLETLGNVRILGFKPTAQLPAYLHAFDVCLIPFLRNRFNEQCDPLKFYQYLAMGKPIVSTPVTVAWANRDLCRVAETHEEFIDAIAETLAGKDNESARQARRAKAREHSWPALVKDAWEIVQHEREKKECAEILECT